MFSKVALFTIWLVLSAGLAPYLHAQEETSIEEQEETADYGEYVVTGTKTERKTETMSKDVVVITRAEIEASRARSVPELLRTKAGIYVRDTLGHGAGGQVDIYGFGEAGSLNTQLLVDGVRADYGDLGGPDWGAIPIGSVERIEVVRGGSSTLHGGNATAGVVNIVTRDDGTNSISASGEAGSWWYKESTSITGRVDDVLGYSINQGYWDSDGHRSNNHYRSKSIHLGLSIEPEDADWFALDFKVGRNDETFGLPGAINRRALESGPRDREDAADELNYTDRWSSYLTVVPKIRLAEGHELSLASTYRERWTYSYFFFQFGPFKSVSELEYRDLVFGFSPTYVWKSHLGEQSNQLTLGADIYKNEKHQISGFVEESQLLTTDFFVHNSFEVLSDVFLDLGYRRGRSKFDFASREHRTFDLDSASAGLSWNYRPGSKVFASFEKAYRVGALDEHTYTVPSGLEPQISETYQLGITHRVADYLTAGLTLFHIETEDEIFFDPAIVVPGSFFTGRNGNYDETSRQGFTAEVSSQLTDHLSLFANYTYLDSELEDNRQTDHSGSHIPLVPQHTANIGGAVDFLEYFTWSISARWQDERYAGGDWDNSQKPLDSYIVTDTKLTFNWKWLTLYGGINNLTDEDYTEFGQYFPPSQSVYPAPGRNFFGGAEITITY